MSDDINADVVRSQLPRVSLTGTHRFDVRKPFVVREKRERAPKLTPAQLREREQSDRNAQAAARIVRQQSRKRAR